MHSLFELFLQWTPVVDEKEVYISHNYKLVHNYDSILHLSHTSPSSILISHPSLLIAFRTNAYVV